MGNLGMPEILVIVIAILVLFGGRKIPEFMRGLGKGIREFNDAKTSVKKELEEGMRETDVKSTTPPSNANLSEYNQFLEWKKQQEAVGSK